MVLKGLPGRRGVYLAHRRELGDEVGPLEGAALGSFRAGSEAFWAAAEAALGWPCDDGQSYLFMTRQVDGRVRLWDGAAERTGGLCGVISADGTGRKPNVALAWQAAAGDFSDDATLHATRRIEAVSARMNLRAWADLEILMDYGPDFPIA